MTIWPHTQYSNPRQSVIHRTKSLNLIAIFLSFIPYLISYTPRRQQQDCTYFLINYGVNKSGYFTPNKKDEGEALRRESGLRSFYQIIKECFFEKNILSKNVSFEYTYVL